MGHIFGAPVAERPVALSPARRWRCKCGSRYGPNFRHSTPRRHGGGVAQGPELNLPPLSLKVSNCQNHHARIEKRCPARDEPSERYSGIAMGCCRFNPAAPTNKINHLAQIFCRNLPRKWPWEAPGKNNAPQQTRVAQVGQYLRLQPATG
jgi:hypothetical protein